MRVGIQSTGYSRWFERLLAELGMELWIGNAAIVSCPSRLQREGPRRRPFAKAIDCRAFCIRVRMRTH